MISLKVNQDIKAGKFAALNFRGYQRVLVQDSTVIKLPAALFPEFSGVSNGHSTVCNARIQAGYDRISGKIIDFSIDPYSKNDLEKVLLRYCCYDKRKKRRNFNETWEFLA